MLGIAVWAGRLQFRFIQSDAGILNCSLGNRCERPGVAELWRTCIHLFCFLALLLRRDIGAAKGQILLLHSIETNTVELSLSEATSSS